VRFGLALGAERACQPDADGRSPSDLRDAPAAGDGRARVHTDSGGNIVHDVHARYRRDLHTAHRYSDLGKPDGDPEPDDRHTHALRRHAHTDAVHGIPDTHGPADADAASDVPSHAHLPGGTHASFGAHASADADVSVRATHLPADTHASFGAHASAHADAVLSSGRPRR
jgi:hypothetical protein